MVLDERTDLQLIERQTSIAEFASQLNTILQVQTGNNIRLALKKILFRARGFLGVDHICVYRALSNVPTLVKLAVMDGENIFPNQLSFDDMSVLLSSGHWISEMSQDTTIHRRAYEEDFHQIGSASIGHENSLFGVIVVVSRLAVQEDVFQRKLELISTIIRVYLDQYILVNHLHSKLERTNKSLQFKNLFFNHTQEGAILVDKALRVLEINSSAEIMLGFTAEEVAGQLVENVLIGAEELMDAIMAAGAGVELTELSNVSLHRRNGQAFAAQIRTIPHNFLNGQTDEILVIFADESENEENRVRARHLEQRAALGGLSAIFAHEVKNPINNISTGLQLLQTRMIEEDPNSNIVERALNDCTRLTNLMESILSFSKPIEPKLKPMDVSMLVSSLLDRWRPRFERLNITANIQAAGYIPKVMGDRRLLEQVFTNLISNAVEVMESTGGTLTFKICESESKMGRSFLEIAVSDTGPGIPDALIGKIFEPFITSKSKGTGLGLSITKQIITAHRGNIHVNSFPGGSIFYVSLPISQGD